MKFFDVLKRAGYGLLAAILLSCTLACAPVPAAKAQAMPHETTITLVAKKAKMVWIPTRGGTKYHSRKSCSGMKGPKKVSLSSAKSRGFKACKKCY